MAGIIDQSLYSPGMVPGLSYGHTWCKTCLATSLREAGFRCRTGLESWGAECLWLEQVTLGGRADPLHPGPKTFELRIDDRNYMVGDILRLTRSMRGSFGAPPRHIKRVRVTYILREFKGLQPGYCVMAVVPDEEQ